MSSTGKIGYENLFFIHLHDNGNVMNRTSIHTTVVCLIQKRIHKKALFNQFLKHLSVSI
jgi:hypothetical protein